MGHRITEALHISDRGISIGALEKENLIFPSGLIRMKSQIESLGQSISGRIDTQTGHLRADRPLSAFRQDDPLPLAFTGAGNLGEVLAEVGGVKAEATWFRSPSGVRRDPELWVFSERLAPSSVHRRRSNS